MLILVFELTYLLLAPYVEECLNAVSSCSSHIASQWYFALIEPGETLISLHELITLESCAEA